MPFFSKFTPDAILFEQDRWIVVNKPIGIETISGVAGQRSLTKLLDDWLIKREGLQAMHVHPCHRLDQDTSGALLFARGKASQQIAMGWFRRRLITKIYLCFVSGQLDRLADTISLPINGQSAITQYQVLSQNSQSSLVKCKIHTGRTNQIRRHFSAIGHPLIGDARFGRRDRSGKSAERALLHAWYLALPIGTIGDQKAIEIIATIPLDMIEFARRQNHQIPLDRLTR